MGLLHQVQEVAFAFSEALPDRLDRILRKLLVLDHEVMQVVPEVVSTGRATMAIEDTKEADLRPLYFLICFVLRLQYVQNDTDSIFVVVSDYTLVCICCVGLDNPTLFLTSLRWLVILKLDGFGVQHSRIVTEQQGLNFNELNVWILGLLTAWWSWYSDSAIVVCYRRCVLLVLADSFRVGLG